MDGRTRHVRVYLTEDEHALVRAAAARADASVSRFSVQAIVEAAKRTVAESATPWTPSEGELGADKQRRGRAGRRK
jgi:hypothetical protein